MGCSVTMKPLIVVALLLVAVSTVVVASQQPSPSTSSSSSAIRNVISSSSSSSLTQNQPPSITTQQKQQQDGNSNSSNNDTKTPNVLLNDDDDDSAQTSTKNGIGGHTTPIIESESAILDKQTGQVYWQSRASTSSVLSTNLNPLFTERGIRHVRATILSSILVSTIVRSVGVYLRDRILLRPYCPEDEEEGLSLGTTSCHKRPWHKWALLLIARCSVLRLPKFDTWFLIITIFLYFIESYTCGTRRYLENALSNPNDVELYLEKMRDAEPIVTWKVRCYHYERRKWLCMILMVDIWKRLFNGGGGDEQVVEGEKGRRSSTTMGGGEVPSFLMRKVVTHTASRQYKYASCIDNSMAGIWKRAQETSTIAAPFVKLSCTKIVVFTDTKSRDNYFTQQSEFVTIEGQCDEYAEFSTNIQVEGFKPKTLAIRPIKNKEPYNATKLFRIHLFWIFTCLGLTLPYRIWFARHCDELRVTVTKETSSSEALSLETGSSWFGSSFFPTRWFSSKNLLAAMELKARRKELFRRRMQQVALYQQQPQPQQQPKKQHNIVTTPATTDTMVRKDEGFPTEEEKRMEAENNNVMNGSSSVGTAEAAAAPQAILVGKTEDVVRPPIVIKEEEKEILISNKASQLEEIASIDDDDVVGKSGKNATRTKNVVVPPSSDDVDTMIANLPPPHAQQQQQPPPPPERETTTIHNTDQEKEEQQQQQHYNRLVITDMDEDGTISVRDATASLPDDEEEEETTSRPAEGEGQTSSDGTTSNPIQDNT